MHRWLILGWVLKFLKSRYYIVMAKQALFFDWLFYDGDIRLYRTYEPVWLMIVNSLGKYREMSEEILEFLFVYSAEYVFPVCANIQDSTRMPIKTRKKAL